MKLLLIALAPVLAIALFVYEKDHEKEPTKLLISAFFLGMLGIVPALALEYVLLIQGFNPFSESLGWSFVSVAIGIALVEELSKYFGVRLWIYRKADFNEPYDGIVYCVMAALGFAAVENVLYVFEGGMAVGYMRAFTAVPAHAIMGVFIGYYLGIQKFDGKRGSEFIGLAAAVTFHTLYDFFAMNAGSYPMLGILFLVSLVWAYRLAKRAINAHRDRSPFHPARLPRREN